jgi:Domain of unknown function (DUF4112)
VVALQGLSEKETAILRLVQRRATFLDQGFNVCGAEFGLSAIICAHLYPALTSTSLSLISPTYAPFFLLLPSICPLRRFHTPGGRLCPGRASGSQSKVRLPNRDHYRHPGGLIVSVAPHHVVFLTLSCTLYRRRIPWWLTQRMMLNLAIAGAIGFVPGLGTVLLTSYRPNVRNAALLEEYLRMRSRRKKKPSQSSTAQAEKKPAEDRIELPDPGQPSEAAAAAAVPGASGISSDKDDEKGASASAGARPDAAPPADGDDKDKDAGAAVPEGPGGDEKDKPASDKQQAPEGEDDNGKGASASAVPGDSGPSGDNGSGGDGGDEKGEGGISGPGAAAGVSGADDPGISTLDTPEVAHNRPDSRFVEEVT